MLRLSTYVVLKRLKFSKRFCDKNRKTNTAESQIGEAFICEDSELAELVQELLKYGIYGEETTLEGIVAAAKKNLDETKSRVEDLKTFVGDERNEGTKNFTLI